MRVATWTVAVLVAVAVPGILVVNGFRVLATDTFVDRELGRDGFPPVPTMKWSPAPARRPGAENFGARRGPR